MVSESLSKERVKELLEKADQKWFADHSGQFKYQEHLEFLADYIVKHYNSRKRHDS